MRMDTVCNKTIKGRETALEDHMHLCTIVDHCIVRPVKVIVREISNISGQVLENRCKLFILSGILRPRLPHTIL